MLLFAVMGCGVPTWQFICSRERVSVLSFDRSAVNVARWFDSRSQLHRRHGTPAGPWQQAKSTRSMMRLITRTLSVGIDKHAASETFSTSRMVPTSPESRRVTRSTSSCARSLLKNNALIVRNIGKRALYTAFLANACSRQKGIDS